MFRFAQPINFNLVKKIKLDFTFISSFRLFVAVQGIVCIGGKFHSFIALAVKWKFSVSGDGREGRGRQENTQQPKQSEPFAYANLCRTLTSSEKGRKVRVEKRSSVSLDFPCNLFRGILDSHAMH